MGGLDFTPEARFEERVEFAPRRFFRNRHVQTLTCAVPLFAPPARLRAVPTENLRVPIEDDGALLARGWFHPASDALATPRPTVLLLHGVGGSDASLYVVRAAVAFLDAGYHVVRLNLRGAGDSVRHVPSLYHMGLTSDVAAAISTLSADPRVGEIYVVGFSGGGNVMLKLAGEWGSAAPPAVAAIASLSAPLDLAAASENIAQPRSFAYHAHVLRGLHRGARGFLRHRGERAPFSLRDLARARSIRRFDEYVTGPMHAFASVDTYYRTASAGPLLSEVRVPSLVLHAKDDPMVPVATVSRALEGASPAVRVEMTDRGGHLGWIVGDLAERGWTRTWAIERTMAFFRSIAEARGTWAGVGETAAPASSFMRA